MSTKFSISIVAAALIGGMSSLGVHQFLTSNNTSTAQQAPPTTTNSAPSKTTHTVVSDTMSGRLNFTKAAKKSTPAVVHITSTYKPDKYQRYKRFYKRYFGEHFRSPFGHRRRRLQPRQQSGSGVILSSDGYIITNNHVIRGADIIEVTLHDRRKYKAKVVGQASSTDLALLKIEEEGLQSIQFANSSQVEIGEWVVAVGNPFNLNSTVTAGIVSAKGRNLQVMNDKWQISSFIQTDAAVNPGNSGGALVDLNGNLIGINTAIASPTGAYAGYAFAIPSNLVKKVVTDLKKYGTVQRGYLGVQISNLNNQLSKKLNIERPKGVYIADVMEESAATGKLKKKDVIIAINDKKVENASKLQQLVALHRPGDEITITFIRDGKKQKTTVTLKNREGTTTLVKKTQDQLLKKLGVQLKDLTEEQQEKLNINGGVKITEVTHGIIPQSTNVRKNFIITKVNNKPVFSVQDVLQALKPKFQDNQKQGILLEGIYPERSGIYYYGFRL